MSAPPVNERDRLGRTLILVGLGLFGVFVMLVRWLVAVRALGALLGILASERTLVAVVLLSSVLTGLGTAALLWRRRSGPVSLTNWAFLAVGAISTGIGVWFCGRVAFEALLGR